MSWLWLLRTHCPANRRCLWPIWQVGCWCSGNRVQALDELSTTCWRSEVSLWGRLRPSLTVGSTQALLQAVSSGAGVGFASLRALDAISGLRLPVPVRLVEVRLRRQLWMVYKSQQEHTPLMRDTIAFFHEWLAAHPAI